MTAGRFRIASYNVHAGIGTDGRFDPERIAKVIASLGADVVALQEVEDRPFGGTTVSAFLADTLGMHAYAGTTLRRGDADYGNLLLSRFAAADIEPIDLAFPGREPRGAIEALFVVGGLRLRVFAAHFGLAGRERRLQLGKLWPRFERGGADLTVLCADLNEWLPVSRVHRALRQRFGATPAPNTFPSRFPVLALDRIYVKPRGALAAIETGRHPARRRASDHLPVVADVRLP